MRASDLYESYHKVANIEWVLENCSDAIELFKRTKGIIAVDSFGITKPNNARKRRLRRTTYDLIKVTWTYE